eukprot:4606566-Amphidinium_carterae.1
MVSYVLLGSHLDNVRVGRGKWLRFEAPQWLESLDSIDEDVSDECAVVAILALQAGAKYAESGLQDWGVQADFLHRHAMGNYLRIPFLLKLFLKCVAQCGHCGVSCVLVSCEQFTSST